MSTRIPNSPATLSALALALSMTAAAALPAFAFGGGGDTATNKPVTRPSVATQPPKPATPTKVCRTGEVWSVKKKGCVKASSQALPDSELLKQGRMLALAGYYRKAIPVLQA